LQHLREFKRFRGQICLFRPIAIATVDLAREWFNILLEAKVLIERWRRHFNTVRPHSSLGYVAPAIYTPVLIEQFRRHLTQAEAALAPLAAKPTSQLTRHEKQLLDRMKFTRLSFGIIDNYMKMVRLAATDADYKAAGAAGATGLHIRDQLTEMSGLFTTYRYLGQPGNKIVESGPAWFSGEVEQYASLAKFTDGPRGKLIVKLPLIWAFRRDPHDTGLASHCTGRPADHSYWRANRNNYQTPASRKDYPTTAWETVRTDLYPQAQGILHPD